MKIKIEIGNGQFEQLGETQRERKKQLVSFFSRKRQAIKMLENPTISAAKVATFNDRSKLFVTI